jgi:hypothetical protein
LIIEERGIAKGVVAESGRVILERKGAKSAVIPSILVGVACVKDHCTRSDSCVSFARFIEQQGNSANGRVVIPLAVEDQRSSTDTSIEVAAPVVEERTPTKRTICSACDEEL